MCSLPRDGRKRLVFGGGCVTVIALAGSPPAEFAALLFESGRMGGDYVADRLKAGLWVEN